MLGNILETQKTHKANIVNIKTIHGVRAITNLTGYKDIDILGPTVLLESEG